VAPAVVGRRLAMSAGRPRGGGGGVDSRLSLRRLLVILLAVLGVLVAGLFVLTTFQLRGANTQTEAENRRTESFRLADQMRQSSNDLTRMVRMYVATGDPRFRAYYDEILAIRAGRAPRPRDYDSSFWDRVLAEGKRSVRYGRPESLTDRMRTARFTPAEFDALNASLEASNGLAKLELDVMERVERRIERGVDDAYFADVYPDYRRLVDDDYLAEKGVIMAAVEHFIDLVDQRTLRDIEQVRADNRGLFVAQIAILAVIVVAGAAAMVVLTRVVLRPLSGLRAATRRIAGGNYDERVDIRAVTELEQVAGAFNEMAGAVQTDVAAREHAERDAVAARLTAEHASRAKSTFLAAMSHEIRTPMIGVTGMLEVLAQTDMTPQQRQMVATAQNSAQSLLQIIGDILDFSKIEAGRLEIAPTTFELRPLMRTAVETFVHTASAKGLLLTWSVDERLAPAHVGDPLRLRQIVSNFLSNAVKFTEVGGIEVAVRALGESSDAQTVEISITDTGVGVPAEQQRRLFEEFAQADAATAQRFGGTGLGLVICKRLAVLMGGDVTMASTPGKGTTMRLTVPLPIGDPGAVDPAMTPTSARLPTARPKPSREQAERERSLLLLAEDHPVNRTVLSHQLDVVGFHVDTAEDGQEAFDKYVTGRYALVFTDLNMPRMDGYELARAIRTHEHETGGTRTPIVALTANVMQGEPDKCAAAGMDDFAAKPSTIPFLAAKLHRWLPHLEWPTEPEPAADGNGAGFGGPVLEELTGGDAAMTAKVLSDFLETSRADLSALSDAVAAHDHDATRRQAHRIAGASRIVGADVVAALAGSVERAAAAEQSNDWGDLGALVDRLEHALAEVTDSAQT
jgi:signal transduction histidine kinase/CheY-like chemotaxis protein/HPt (histidine-containing phosphotransfer) domain-containing protein